MKKITFCLQQLCASLVQQVQPALWKIFQLTSLADSSDRTSHHLARTIILDVSTRYAKLRRINRITATKSVRDTIRILAALQQ